MHALLQDKKRLVLEHQAMLERWPRARWCRNAAGTDFWWEFTIKGEAGDMRIKVEYPSNYPAAPPTIQVLDSLPSGVPHLLGGQHLCWIYPGEKRRSTNMWKPSQDTAATAIAAACRWYYAFVVWLALGEWPVPDALD